MKTRSGVVISVNQDGLPAGKIQRYIKEGIRYSNIQFFSSTFVLSGILFSITQFFSSTHNFRYYLWSNLLLAVCGINGFSVRFGCINRSEEQGPRCNGHRRGLDSMQHHHQHHYRVKCYSYSVSFGNTAWPIKNEKQGVRE